MNTHHYSRRAFLRGAGVTMALPWLESFNVWGDEPKKNKPASEAPVRLCVTFSGNGFQSREWWAKGEGKAMELGRVLSPLSEFKEKLLFVRGLYHEEARKGNIHSSQTGNMLSGAPIASGGEIRSGTSFDQLLAQTYGRSTKVPSLVLACEKSNPSVHKNYSMLYSSHISWSSPTTPTPLELYPALAFDRLFKDESSPADKSVLDAVLTDAQDLRRDISSSDQRKLDEYLDSVREVEKRIENAGKRGELQGWRPTLDKPNMQRPADGIPQELASQNANGTVKFVNNEQSSFLSSIDTLKPWIFGALAAYVIIFISAAVAWRWPYLADVRAGRRKKADFSLYGSLVRLQPGVLPIRLLLVLLLVFAAAASCFEWLFPWAASTIPMLQEMSNYTAI